MFWTSQPPAMYFSSSSSSMIFDRRKERESIQYERKERILEALAKLMEEATKDKNIDRLVR